MRVSKYCETEWYATLKLTRNSAYFFSQRDNLIASWRSLAMFCCSCIDIPGLEEKIRSINSGREEVFRPSSLREKGLIQKDWRQFGTWLMQQRELTTAKINKELARLYHWRWAYWHVMGAPEGAIPLAKSMLIPLLSNADILVSSQEARTP